MFGKIVRLMLSLVICGCLLIGGSYAYLKYKAPQILSGVEAEKKDEPYTSSKGNTPDNCGILFKMPDNSGCLLYLDFGKLNITVIPADDVSEVEESYKGYEVNNTVNCNYELISTVVNRIGGLNTEIDGESIRLSGEQTVELICEDESDSRKKELILSAAKAIKENGITRSDIVYIIGNCDCSGLSLANCYYWSEYLGEMSDNVNVII